MAITSYCLYMASVFPYDVPNSNAAILLNKHMASTGLPMTVDNSFLLVFFPVWSGFNITIIYYRPKRSLGQGNVFTSVCHSVHRRGDGFPACITGHMTGIQGGGWFPACTSIQGEGFASRGGSASRRQGVCIWGIRGVCIQERGLHPGRGVCIRGRGLHPGGVVYIQGRGLQPGGGVG